MEPGRKPSGFLRGQAHRYGIARQLNASYHGTRGLQSELVETALPWRALALYAAGHYGMRIVKVTHHGRLRRRWRLVPRGRC